LSIPEARKLSPPALPSQSQVALAPLRWCVSFWPIPRRHYAALPASVCLAASNFPDPAPREFPKSRETVPAQPVDATPYNELI